MKGVEPQPPGFRVLTGEVQASLFACTCVLPTGSVAADPQTTACMKDFGGGIVRTLGLNAWS